ncbi:hypothetical protein [Mucilaginibacter sp. HD30]
MPLCAFFISSDAGWAQAFKPALYYYWTKPKNHHQYYSGIIKLLEQQSQPVETNH